MGVFSSFRHFRARLVGRSALTLTVNVSVLAYINRQGGTLSVVLDKFASQLWVWCKGAKNFSVCVTYLGRGVSLSGLSLQRQKCLPSEWMLSPVVFSRLVSVFGVLDIDLFAFSLNLRLLRFYS